MKFPVTFSLFALALSVATLQKPDPMAPDFIPAYAEKYRDYLEEVFGKVYIEIVSDLSDGLDALEEGNQSFLSETAAEMDPALKQELIERVSNSLVEALTQAGEGLIINFEEKMKIFLGGLVQKKEELDQQLQDLKKEVEVQTPLGFKITSFAELQASKNEGKSS